MNHDGISPEDAERLLVRPMEKQLQSISGVKDVKSTANEGHASVLLEFDAGFDGDQALADVREKVDAAKSELPAATDEPSVNEVNVSLFPVLNVSLSGPIPERTLITIARELKDALEALPGVLEADIAGEREEVLEIVVDPRRHGDLRGRLRRADRADLEQQPARRGRFDRHPAPGASC